MLFYQGKTLIKTLTTLTPHFYNTLPPPTSSILHIYNSAPPRPQLHVWRALVLLGRQATSKGSRSHSFTALLSYLHHSRRTRSLSFGLPVWLCVLFVRHARCLWSSNHAFQCPRRFVYSGSGVHPAPRPTCFAIIIKGPLFIRFIL